MRILGVFALTVSMMLAGTGLATAHGVWEGPFGNPNVCEIGYHGSNADVTLHTFGDISEAVQVSSIGLEQLGIERFSCKAVGKFKRDGGQPFIDGEGDCEPRRNGRPN